MNGGKKMEEFKTTEVKKPNFDEMKRVLKEDYMKNAERLKRIPEELSQVKLNLELTKEDIGLKKESSNLIIEDFEIRIKNFAVKDPKYEWELNPDWQTNQKKIIGLEIRKAQFNFKMLQKSLSSNELNTQAQIDDIESQRKRCKEAHKTVLKRLLDECNVGTEEYSELKKNCTCECCR